jgi:hypothetical protein
VGYGRLPGMDNVIMDILNYFMRVLLKLGDVSMSVDILDLDLLALNRKNQ